MTQRHPAKLAPVLLDQEDLVSDASGFNLRDGLALSGIDPDELYLRYIALGGNSDRAQVDRHIRAATCPDEHDHNVIAQAINEAFLERGQDHPVAYKNLPELPLPADPDLS